MARVTVTYVFTNGETIHVTAVGKRSYPDAMSELRATATRGMHDALAEITAHQATPAEAGE